MKAATTAKEMIDVDALRIGMFVHLDVGWMSHPFPLSSFRIASADQVATIRSLGLHRVRWSPQQSEMPGMPEALHVQGLDAAGAGPAEFGALMKSEIAKYGKVVKTAGIRGE